MTKMMKFKNNVANDTSPFLPPKIIISTSNIMPNIVIALIDFHLAF